MAYESSIKKNARARKGSLKPAIAKQRVNEAKRTAFYNTPLEESDLDEFDHHTQETGG